MRGGMKRLAASFAAALAATSAVPLAATITHHPQVAHVQQHDLAASLPTSALTSASTDESEATASAAAPALAFSASTWQAESAARPLFAAAASTTTTSGGVKALSSYTKRIYLSEGVNDSLVSNVATGVHGIEITDNSVKYDYDWFKPSELASYSSFQANNSGSTFWSEFTSLHVETESILIQFQAFTDVTLTCDLEFDDLDVTFDLRGANVTFDLPLPTGSASSPLGAIAGVGSNITIQDTVGGGSLTIVQGDDVPVVYMGTGGNTSLEQSRQLTLQGNITIQTNLTSPAIESHTSVYVEADAAVPTTGSLMPSYPAPYQSIAGVQVYGPGGALYVEGEGTGITGSGPNVVIKGGTFGTSSLWVYNDYATGNTGYTLPGTTTEVNYTRYFADVESFVTDASHAAGYYNTAFTYDADGQLEVTGGTFFTGTGYGIKVLHGRQTTSELRSYFGTTGGGKAGPQVKVCTDSAAQGYALCLDGTKHTTNHIVPVLDIKSGTYEGFYAIYHEEGTSGEFDVHITGGEFYGNLYDFNTIRDHFHIEGGNYYFDTYDPDTGASTDTYANATDKRLGVDPTTGGTFSNPTNYASQLHNGYVARPMYDTSVTPKKLVGRYVTIDADSSVAMIDRTSVAGVGHIEYYKSLADAFEASADGETITLTHNATLKVDPGSANTNFKSVTYQDKALTLDLAGNRLTIDGTAVSTDPLVAVTLDANASLDLIDTGKKYTATLNGSTWEYYPVYEDSSGNYVPMANAVPISTIDQARLNTATGEYYAPYTYETTIGGVTKVENEQVVVQGIATAFCVNGAGASMTMGTNMQATPGGDMGVCINHKGSSGNCVRVLKGNFTLSGGELLGSVSQTTSSGITSGVAVTPLYISSIGRSNSLVNVTINGGSVVSNSLTDQVAAVYLDSANASLGGTLVVESRVDSSGNVISTPTIYGAVYGVRISGGEATITDGDISVLPVLTAANATNATSGVMYTSDSTTNVVPTALLVENGASARVTVQGGSFKGDRSVGLEKDDDTITDVNRAIVELQDGDFYGEVENKGRIEKTYEVVEDGQTKQKKYYWSHGVLSIKGGRYWITYAEKYKADTTLMNSANVSDVGLQPLAILIADFYGISNLSGRVATTDPFIVAYNPDNMAAYVSGSKQMYKTIEEAIQAAVTDSQSNSNSPRVVVLMRDLVDNSATTGGSDERLKSRVVIGESNGVKATVTLDLAGFTLGVGTNASVSPNTTGCLVVERGSNLYITDSKRTDTSQTPPKQVDGKVDIHNTASGASSVTLAPTNFIEARDTGTKVIVHGGVFEAHDGSSFIAAANGVDVTIQDGTFVADGSYTDFSVTPNVTTVSTIVSVQANAVGTSGSTASLTVNGGTFKATSLGGQAIRSGSVTTLSNGVTTSTDPDTSLKITGGTFITESAASNLYSSLPPLIQVISGKANISVSVAQYDDGGRITITTTGGVPALQVDGGTVEIGYSSYYTGMTTPDEDGVTISSTTTAPALFVTDEGGTWDITGGTLSHTITGTPTVNVYSGHMFGSGLGNASNAEGASLKTRITEISGVAPRSLTVYGGLVEGPVYTVTTQGNGSIGLHGGWYLNTNGTAGPNAYDDGTNAVYIDDGTTGGPGKVKPYERTQIADNAQLAWVNPFPGSTNPYYDWGDPVFPTAAELKVYAMGNSSTTLTQGTDYTVAYYKDASHTQAITSADTWNVNTTVYMVIKGIGHYRGTVERSYTLQPIRFDANNLEITFIGQNAGTGTSASNPPTYTYTTAAGGVTPQVQVTYKFLNPDGTAVLDTSGNPKTMVLTEDSTLTQGHYHVDYLDNIKANTTTATAKVKITGRGVFSQGSYVTAAFMIEPKSLTSSDITVDPIATQGWTGSHVKPHPVVKDGTKELTEGATADYTLSYADNVNEGTGTATVTITGRGNYGGVLTCNFSISKAASNVAVVPSVYGKLQAEATTLLNTDFKVVSIIQEPSETVEKGRCIRTEPTANSWQEKGTEITLYVSQGDPSTIDVVVPDVKGVSPSQARVTLQGRSLIAREEDVQYEYSDTVPFGCVTRTDPAIGTNAKMNSTVVMYVSRGSDKITLPKVIGYSQANATSKLEGLGFVVVTETASDNDVRRGCVISQSPEALSLQYAGTTIKLVISLGPDESGSGSGDNTGGTGDNTGGTGENSGGTGDNTGENTGNNTGGNSGETGGETGSTTVPRQTGDTATATVTTNSDGSKTTRLTTDTGSAASGWQTAGGETYYAGQGGTALTGTREIAGKTYVFDSEGKLQTGWCYDEKTHSWLYATPAEEAAQTGATTGEVKKNSWVCSDGEWFVVDEDGHMQTGWVHDPWGTGEWYYFNPSTTNGTYGAMRTGWFWDGANWYLANDSGEMQSGWVYDISQGSWYYLNTAHDGAYGAMQTGWIWDGSNWYYAGADGKMQTGWRWLDGEWYYLNPGPEGNQGEMATGWTWVEGNWYYLRDTGQMVRSQFTPDGYWVNNDGVIVW